jgi:SAM-dependent MidA family methyltransferase
MEPSNPLEVAIRNHLAAQGGWMGFDDFMQQALYTPGLGYYANELPKFGDAPQAPEQPEGSDFVTAPELTSLFGYALARQVAQALQATGTDEIWEFGAGSGALAGQLLDALDEMGVAVRRYTVVELSQTLAARQRAGLERHAARLHWAEVLPDAMCGVLIGNEVLDAMPVQLLARVGGVWHERGVVAMGEGFVWSDRPSSLRPPCEIEGDHDYLCEIHPQAEAFVRSLGQRLQRGLILLLDYGFGQDEYYHPQRHMGTVMCHQAHQSDMNPLVAVGLKDITAHVNFTGIALAGQDQGLHVLGYTSQARFLLNLGLAEAMAQAELAERSQAQRLMAEHEMGELFKVLGFSTSDAWQARGFAAGDRSHRL